MLEAQEKKVSTSSVIRFVGGGALSALTCQILADVLGRKVETVNKPQNVGAVGAAVVVATGIGLLENLSQAESFIPASHEYLPNTVNKKIYDKGFEVFKQLYTSSKKNFAKLNSMRA